MRGKTKERITGKESHPESIIRVQGLSKSYEDIRALHGVGFSVRRGGIFAYLGPNGAGKTTTINILCGLLRPDTGSAMVCGHDIERDPVAVKQRIGVVPEESNLYPELGCARNLEYLGELYGLPRASRKKRAGELLRTFDLADRAMVPFRTLSRGLKRRLTVAAALIHSPELVFLDEPTAGLDVPSARSLRTLIRSINRDGTTVFLTTHNLAEAEDLCDRMVILVKGRIIDEGSPADIRRRVERAKMLSMILTGETSAERLREECPAVQSAFLEDGRWRLEVVNIHEALTQVTRFAEKQGHRVLELNSVAPSLEDAFMTLVQNDSEGRVVS